MDLLIGSRRAGKTTELLSRWLAMLAEGKRVYYLCGHEAERKRILVLLREAGHQIDEKLVVTFDGALWRQNLSKADADATLVIDNLDLLLRQLFRICPTLASATDIEPTRLGENPYVR